MGVEQLDGMCVYKGLCFTWGSVMQINDLLQCRAEQHKACTPVHHSTASVPPLQAGGKKKSLQPTVKGLGAGGGECIHFAQRPWPFTPFFFIPAKKTTILDLHLLNWSDGDQSFLKRPQLHRDTISGKSHFT